MKIKMFDEDGQQILAEIPCERMEITLDDETIVAFQEPESGTLQIGPAEDSCSLVIEIPSADMLYLKVK